MKQAGPKRQSKEGIRKARRKERRTARRKARRTTVTKNGGNHKHHQVGHGNHKRHQVGPSGGNHNHTTIKPLGRKGANGVPGTIVDESQWRTSLDLSIII